MTTELLANLTRLFTANLTDQVLSYGTRCYLQLATSMTFTVCLHQTSWISARRVLLRPARSGCGAEPPSTTLGCTRGDSERAGANRISTKQGTPLRLFHFDPLCSPPIDPQSVLSVSTLPILRPSARFEDSCLGKKGHFDAKVVGQLNIIPRAILPKNMWISLGVPLKRCHPCAPLNSGTARHRHSGGRVLFT